MDADKSKYQAGEAYNVSKREYFAGLAMQGLAELNNISLEYIAERSVKLADALLKELEKGE